MGFLVELNTIEDKINIKIILDSFNQTTSPRVDVALSSPDVSLEFLIYDDGRWKNPWPHTGEVLRYEKYTLSQVYSFLEEQYIKIDLENTAVIIESQQQIEIMAGYYGVSNIRSDWYDKRISQYTPEEGVCVHLYSYRTLNSWDTRRHLKQQQKRQLLTFKDWLLRKDIK